VTKDYATSLNPMYKSTRFSWRCITERFKPQSIRDEQQSLAEQSAFSFLRTLTTWHCSHSPAAHAAECRPYSNQLMSPARREHSSKPAAAVCCCGPMLGQTDRRTGRRTDVVPLHRPCCAYFANKERFSSTSLLFSSKTYFGKRRGIIFLRHNSYY